MILSKLRQKLAGNDSAESFIKQANQEMEQKLNAHKKAWGFDSHTEHFMDMDAGTITFAFDNKKVVATMFVIGSLANGEFLWAWDNPSLRTGDKLAADQVHQWGIDHNLPDYTIRKVPADMHKALEFTNVAAKLVNADGVYAMSFTDERTPDAKKSYLFMIFDKPKV